MQPLLKCILYIIKRKVCHGVKFVLYQLVIICVSVLTTLAGLQKFPVLRLLTDLRVVLYS